MQTHFEQDLTQLKNRVLTMASHAERAVRQAVEALQRRDIDLAEAVRSGDSVLDGLELEIDDTAIALLAKAPLASDLRLITVAMKISQNLERVGDEATKISKRARELASQPPLKVAADLSQMVDMSLKLLKSALDAFVRQDAGTARALIPQDKEVDELNREIQAALVNEMMANSESITRCLHYMVVVKSLERIADHGKNIAEEVVYLREAEDIRHPKAVHLA
jgi:phosphate transport system protein